MQPILFLIIGIVVGLIIGWLIAKLLSGNSSKTAELNAALLQQNTLSGKLELIEREKQKQEKFFGEQLQKNEADLKEERNKNTETEKKIAQLLAEKKATEDKFLVQKIEIEGLQKKFTIEFENIANKLLDEKTQKFTESNKTQMDIILTPLKDNIKKFEDQVQKSYKTESDERITLKTEIKNLIDLNYKISLEANNLASALKGSNKTQGNWGEMILEKILEVSGLTKDVEYKIQFSSTNEEGKTLRPDVVILMPDEKNLVIDAKVSLIAYEQFVNSENEKDRETFLKAHVDSIKTHIKGLRDKNYTELAGVKTPDFVLLFIPIEASFAAALHADHELYNYAWDRKIVMVSPTTLLATLRTVSHVWRREKQVRNALAIAKQAGNMHDAFADFVNHLGKLGDSIEKSQKLYFDSMKKLNEGKGNLVKRANDLKELGIKTSKKIDAKHIDSSNENLFEESPSEIDELKDELNNTDHEE